MLLPEDISKEISELYHEIKNDKIKDIQQGLTDKYKNKTGTSKNLIESKNESILYAISRMPATFSVLYTLLKELTLQGKILNVNSIFDFGSGTGSAYFACKEIFECKKIELFERDENMIETFSKLTKNEVKVNKVDLISSKINENFEPADLCLSSYVLSEMNEFDRERVFEKMLALSKKYVLVVDTGTPKTYENMMKLKTVAKKFGFFITAPCKCEVCSLQNDYCQFYARVERSSLLRQAKNATLSYEDEKYFYLLFQKKDGLLDNNENFYTNEFCRVIRRPKIKTNEIELVLCSKDGVTTKIFTKKDKDKFKKAKKIKINQEI